jgi:hypothetical protein
MPDNPQNPLMRRGALLPRANRRITGDKLGPTSLPEFGMVVGQDSYSAGSSAWLWLPSGGSEPSYKLLAAHRWTSRIQSGEEAVQLAYRLLRHVGESQGYDLQ